MAPRRKKAKKAVTNKPRKVLTVSPQMPHLLRLTAEVRSKIYRFVFENAWTHCHLAKGRQEDGYRAVLNSRHSKDVCLLLVSRLVDIEARDLGRFMSTMNLDVELATSDGYNMLLDDVSFKYVQLLVMNEFAWSNELLVLPPCLKALLFIRGICTIREQTCRPRQPGADARIEVANFVEGMFQSGVHVNEGRAWYHTYIESTRARFRLGREVHIRVLNTVFV